MSCTYCVPDLELDNFVIDFQTVRSELDPDRYLMFCFELVVHHSLHQTRLADTRVTNDDQLEKMILVSDSLVG